MRKRALVAGLVLLVGCKASTVAVEPADLGVPSTWDALSNSITTSGPIEFKKHLAAHWAVPLSGLLNLEHPKAIEAGLEDKEESIDIYVYSIEHPQFGTFIVDSGVSESFSNSSVENEASWIVESAMNMAALDVQKTTKVLDSELGGIDGVLLTHIHMDHIMGLPDLTGTPVYGGPGDASLSTFMNLFTQGTTNRILETVQSIGQWQFDDEGVIDVFGDGSLWAIHTPGHTPGATAYLANTTNGPQLMIGDATHTAWGWRNGVEPGTYSHDIEASKESLSTLKTLELKHTNLNIHPGHQSL